MALDERAAQPVSPPGGAFATFLATVTSVSVRTKIMGIVLALTVILGFSVTLQVRGVMTETLLAELDNRGHSVVSDLAARSVGPLLANDIPDLHELLVETLANHPDTRYALVVDATGNVITSTFADGVPPALLALHPVATLQNATHIHYENYEGTIHDFTMPVLASRRGAVRLGLAETRLQGTIDAVTRRMLLTTLIIALVGILAAILLTWLLTRPILDLVTTTNRVRRGDLTARAPHWTDDEIGDLANDFNQLICELQRSQETVLAKEAARSHLLSRLIEAQEDERKRIARDLHDDVGQALTSMLVQMRLLQQHSADAAQQKQLTQLRTVADETLTTVRLLSRQLRTSTLDDLGLAAALERYTSEFTSRYPALTVDLHCELAQRLPPMVEISLYRIIQEAMTNAARHSQATTIGVLVTLREHRVQAIIEDDGVGFDVEAVRRARSSVGLHSMIERTELLDGKLQLESGAEGTTVFVEIPI